MSDGFQIDVKNNVAVIQSDKVILTDAQSALDLIATVRYQSNCDRIAIPKSAVARGFFTLSNGIAGDILQKFVNYHVRLAIVGDFSMYTSKPLQDFIYESNKGTHIFFVADEADAVNRLTV